MSTIPLGITLQLLATVAGTLGKQFMRIGGVKEEDAIQKIKRLESTESDDGSSDDEENSRRKEEEEAKSTSPADVVLGFEEPGDGKKAKHVTLALSQVSAHSAATLGLTAATLGDLENSSGGADADAADLFGPLVGL